MGPEGHATRAEFARLGSVLTYGYIDEAAAPGQPSAADLKQQLLAGQ
jgi:3-dehydroquinate dehydratase